MGRPRSHPPWRCPRHLTTSRATSARQPPHPRQTTSSLFRLASPPAAMLTDLGHTLTLLPSARAPTLARPLKDPARPGAECSKFAPTAQDAIAKKLRARAVGPVILVAWVCTAACARRFSPSRHRARGAWLRALIVPGSNSGGQRRDDIAAVVSTPVRPNVKRPRTWRLSANFRAILLARAGSRITSLLKQFLGGGHS